MKHDPDFARGDTFDLVTCLRLTNLPAGTRILTILAVHTVRDVLTGGPDLPVAAFEAAVTDDPAALKAALGSRGVQILSDARRAIRAWQNAPRRALALRLRSGLPTLEDAASAYALEASEDAGRRCAAAIAQLAASQGTTASGLTATATVIEPLLRAATPETFCVATVKALSNKLSLIRKAIELVDPTYVQGREADVAALSQPWRAILATVEKTLPAHEVAARAILRRLAVQADRAGHAPLLLTADFVAGFVDQERATHADTYIEKVRSAMRHWNAAVLAGLPAAPLDLPVARSHRQASVSWSAVPSDFRAPIDAIAAKAVSARAISDLGALVGDVDEEDSELGLPSASALPRINTNPAAGGAIVLELGTVKNWRDATKRAWHAAVSDPKVTVKPKRFEDLFTRNVALAIVRSARGARRQRCEILGTDFDVKVKGRYEHSLLESLVRAGAAVGIDAERLEQVNELKREIDPSVIAHKMATDGTLKRVYADRKIGVRHATMLRAFQDLSTLRRWFEAPSTLWRLARQPHASGRRTGLSHVALARNALIAQIAQRVAPLRRTNFARMRHRGPDRHLHLPIGDGSGWLIIPAIETKTLKQIKVRIDPETVRLLKIYIAEFLPIAQRAAKALPENPHLFPGAGGSEPADGGYIQGTGYLTKGKLCASFRKHVFKHSRLRMCLHVMRHLAGKIILDQDPSAMGLVKEILGHRKIETTQAYYAEVCAIIAQSRYLHLLDIGTRRALAKIDFTIGIRKLIKKAK